MEGSIKNFNKHLTYYPSGKLKERGVFTLTRLVLMKLRNLRCQLEDGKDGTKMEERSISKNSTKKVKMMAFLFIGIKTELRLEEWYYKNGEKDGPFKIWFENGKKI